MRSTRTSSSESKSKESLSRFRGFEVEEWRDGEAEGVSSYITTRLSNANISTLYNLFQSTRNCSS